MQGDPFLVMVMEYLIRILKTLGMLPEFKFHPMCKDVQLTHLIFVDDDLMYSVKRTVGSLHGSTSTFQ